MDEAPLVVGLGGSTGATSVSGLLLRHALRAISDRGARTALFSATELAELPMYPERSSAADHFVDTVRRADAIVVATPGYHGGMSGLVKNALDHLEALRDDERPYLEGRAVGAIVAAAGWQASGTTLVAVRSAVHALRGWPTPFAVTVNSVEQAPDDAGAFDVRVSGAVDLLAAQLVQFVGWQVAARVSADRGAP